MSTRVENTLLQKVGNHSAVNGQLLTDREDQVTIRKVQGAYTANVLHLVVRLLQLMARQSNQERMSIENEKKDILRLNKDWGVLQKQIGNRTLYTALGALAFTAFAPKIWADEYGKRLATQFGKKGIDAIGHMLNTSTQAQQRVVDGAKDLKNSSVQEKISKATTDGNKQEVLGLLENVQNAKREAAKGG